MGLTLPQAYLDFSANINPLGPPKVLKENWNDIYNRIATYPDPYALTLKNLISQKEQIPPESLLVGNGGAEIIYLIARMLEGKSILLAHPTFSEYEQACRAHQCEIISCRLEAPDFKLNLDQIIEKLPEAGAMFFCQPNNPTGIAYSVFDILKLIEACEKRQSLFILDEAFYDFLTEKQSLITYINEFSNLIIIRSLTKMFAIPGLRLGYAAAHPDIIARLQSLQPHWSTNAVAIAAGELCIKEEAFIRETKDYISRERETLFTYLKKQKFRFTASKVNFYLLQDPYIEDQFPFFEFLLRHSIIPRHTFNFAGLSGKWLRLAVRSSEENRRLMEVLDRWRMHHH